MVRLRRGATALEFALILPVFVTLISGLIDFGWLFFQQSALDTSTSVGCRAGALVDPGIGEAEIEDVRDAAEAAMLQAISDAGAPCSELICQTEVETFGTSPGRSLTCTVVRDFEPLIGFVVDAQDLSAVAAVRLEWQRL